MLHWTTIPRLFCSDNHGTTINANNTNTIELAVDSVKRPRFYNKATADPFSRLRVPKYLKSFEVVFFVVFLFLYYSVLVERNPERISMNEILLYIWFAAFSYDELSEYVDAGSIFYATDVRCPCQKSCLISLWLTTLQIWNIFDITMIGIGFIFAVMRTSNTTSHSLTPSNGHPRDRWSLKTRLGFDRPVIRHS